MHDAGVPLGCDDTDRAPDGSLEGWWVGVRLGRGLSLCGSSIWSAHISRGAPKCIEFFQRVSAARR